MRAGGVEVLARDLMVEVGATVKLDHLRVPGATFNLGHRHPFSIARAFSRPSDEVVGATPLLSPHPPEVQDRTNFGLRTAGG